VVGNWRGQRPGKEPELDEEEAFWHELVACGIGGRTVAEAKLRMTYDEFLRWCEFRNTQGSLHVGMRIDRAVSRALANYFSAMTRGKRFKPTDFSPYDQQSSKVDIDDPDAVFNVLKGVTNGT
jgi:hypothetical protein